MLDHIEINFKVINKENHIFLNSKDVRRRYQTAGNISKSLRYRYYCLRSQTDGRFTETYAENNNVILDGRDIGTVVFPEADFKFYMVADIETRAKRRKLELDAKGIKTDLDELIDELAWRDINDSTRDNRSSKKS
jgi:cytidylate kinase